MKVHELKSLIIKLTHAHGRSSFVHMVQVTFAFIFIWNGCLIYVLSTGSSQLMHCSVIMKYYFHHHAYMSKFIRIMFSIPVFLFTSTLLAHTISTYLYTVSKYFSERSRAECNHSGTVPITYCFSMA